LVGAQERGYGFLKSHQGTIYLSIEGRHQCEAASFRATGRFPGRGVPEYLVTRRESGVDPIAWGKGESDRNGGVKGIMNSGRPDLLLYVGVVFGLSSGLLPICIEQEIR
jgi:hypothetical protein